MTDIPMYHDGSRGLQDRYRRANSPIDSWRWSHVAFTDDDRAFIECRPMFFLATADAEGRPDCSYKGGRPGFVRVIDPDTLAFPSYDGNGMFKSLGNVLVNPQVGLLFIDFESPKRLRVNGRAHCARGRPAPGRAPRRPARRARAGRGDLPELPALHPPMQHGRDVGVRARARGTRRPCPSGSSVQSFERCYRRMTLRRAIARPNAEARLPGISASLPPPASRPRCTRSDWRPLARPLARPSRSS